jgi:hypothetical protein
MQPHAPFLNSLGKYDSINKNKGEGNSQNVWSGLQQGKYTKEEIWSDYGQNLRMVLDEVKRLVNNIDGSVVISADHGNAIGEFGIYGHPGYVPVPALKRVPWVRLDAADNWTVEPENPIKPGLSNTQVEEHLQDLGYIIE